MDLHDINELIEMGLEKEYLEELGISKNILKRCLMIIIEIIRRKDNDLS